MAQQAKNDRKYFRSALTRLYNRRNDIPTLSIDELRGINIKLNEMESDLNRVNESVQANLYAQATPPSDNDYFTEKDECDSYNDKIIDLRVKLDSAISIASSQVNNNSNDHQQKFNLKVPSAPLPTYSGANTESLEKFLYNFEAIVDKYGNLSDYEKFLLLMG